MSRCFPAFNAGATEDVGPHGSEGRVRGAPFAGAGARRSRCHRERLTGPVICPGDWEGRAVAEFVVHCTYPEPDAGLLAARGQRDRLSAGVFLSPRQGRIAFCDNLVDEAGLVR
ncbi:hypothetical protein [Rhodovulum sp. MB263]|uniref:hypothetical protein n=1 Tax=Rhodovulum sp. (strain MB263) TaxID=308754 RepID=UPI0009B72A72|nr:hypothetical protein [Rhodovulum sp. MB263]ARC90346.1 hypothetical protein B5V46_17955 [Rhodovulum sp. MB263]